MEGGALRVGLRCGGEGGTGPTLIWYLREAGAAATEAWDVVVASAGPTVGLPWVAVGAVAAVEGTTVAAATVVGGGAAATAGLGLDLPTGGGEELRTWGLKLCPSCVFRAREGEERMG